LLHKLFIIIKYQHTKNSNIGQEKFLNLFYNSSIENERCKMNQQIKKVLYYIETNLEESFVIEDLAKIAGYSKFHFCRIFKLSVGESIMDYILRLRIEKSSFKLVQYSSIIDVALDVGYKTPNGFNKAFKKLFGITPTQYKKIKNNFLKRFKRDIMDTPKIVELEEKLVVFTRETGDYEQSSKKAWEKLSENLNKLEESIPDEDLINIDQNIELDESKGEYFGICHDDPTITKSENIRYDAAIAWKKEDIEFLSKYGFETKSIQGGKYVMVQYIGVPEKNLDTWFTLYKWCDENGYNFRDIPAFEKYINILTYPNEPEKQITEIYIPIH